MLHFDGRPLNVYSNGYYPKADNLRHEVLLTNFLFPFFEFSKIKRGKKCDQFIQPDAEMEMDGRKYFVEMDTGSVHHPKQKRRWKRYDKVVHDFLLVVTLSEVRMHNLIKHASAVSSVALFTTLEQAIKNPFGEIWHACDDERRVALPKPAGLEV